MRPERVGLIGVGRMGKALARHILRSGYELAVFDIQRAAVEEVAQFGATPCSSGREVAVRSSIVLVSVGFGSELMQAVRGPEGVWAGAMPGSILAVASTVAPELMRELAAEAAAVGMSVMDVPMCRGEEAADAGDLLALVGGDAPLFARIEPLLRTFASDVVLLGALGAGQVGKALNNFLLWACNCADHEMFRLAAGYGLDPEAVRKGLLLGSGSNHALDVWNRKGGMAWAEKDMAIVLEMADRLRISLPLAGVVREGIKALKVERGIGIPHPETAFKAEPNSP